MDAVILAVNKKKNGVLTVLVVAHTMVGCNVVLSLLMVFFLIIPTTTNKKEK